MFVPLWVKSNGSFLEGASHPEELVERAFDLGLRALAITDRDGLYGAVRAHAARRALARKGPALRLIVGAEVTVAGSRPASSDHRVLLLAENRRGYGNLCRLLTRGHARAETKGASRVHWDEVRTLASDGILALAIDPEGLYALVESHRGRLFAALLRHFEEGDAQRERAMRAAAAALGVPTVAQREVLYHVRSRQPLQDVLTCIRHGVSLSTAGRHLRPNAEHDLVGEAAMLRLFSDDPASVHRAGEIADRCTFDLGTLRYRYPAEKVPHGKSERDWLRELTYEGAASRYPNGIPDAVRAQIERELALIEELDYGGYFLTMWDIVRFCREANILCQGRGSAANSVVCYCLGITAIDPVRMDLLFERFLSRERAEPPDIDLDIEHERREEVIQYVYDRWGRAPDRERVEASRTSANEPPPPHAAMVANVIRYRPKSALRDVGKVLDLPALVLDRASKRLSHFDTTFSREALRDAGLDPDSPAVQRLLRLTAEIEGFPRHLGIHPGGFVLGHEPIDTLCPVEPAAMPGRTVLQWDKTDIEELGLFKLDLLGLGALSVIHRAFELLRVHEGIDLAMHTVPAEDPATYAMVSRGDTVGVFQIESRAQMAMLPRLRPRTFYDLVIEVAIVRPGPIQGDMVHPYLRRREGKEPVTYPHPRLERVLGKTLGVPIFQEQVMKLAIEVAGYSPGEADQLRRDMAAWRSKGRLEAHHERLVGRMVADGIPREFAERVFAQIRGFGEYGFPESHAASFALVTYVTAWLKCHHPAAFACALLNAWPMGFYHPSTIVDDAKRHGVSVLPIDVQTSAWDCRLEPVPEGRWAIRMGLRYVKGLGEREKHAFLAAREEGHFTGLADFARRTRMHGRALRALAQAGAFASFGATRREALWEILRLSNQVLDGLPLETECDDPRRETPLTLARAQETKSIDERAVDEEKTKDRPHRWIRALGRHEQIVWDYRTSLHSTRGHPMEAYRAQLTKLGYPVAADVARKNRGVVRFAGLVICRQRPETASGVVFMTLEDETGFVNVVVWADVHARFERIAKTSVILGVRGRVQEESGVVHIVADELVDLGERLEVECAKHRLGDVDKSRNFH